MAYLECTKIVTYYLHTYVTYEEPKTTSVEMYIELYTLNRNSCVCTSFNWL